MKAPRKSLLFLLLALPLTFSCSESDNLPKPKVDKGTTTNTNANPTTDNTAYARLEFPHIKTTGNNLVIVHSTPLGRRRSFPGRHGYPGGLPHYPCRLQRLRL